MAGRPKNTPKDFWAKVGIRGPDECWFWKCGKSRYGYGHHTIDKKNFASHRVAWQLANGTEPPRNLMVMHSCNNKACCNPAHLSMGTAKENSVSAHESGLCRVGERHHRTIHPPHVIEAIRSDTRSQSAIAADYGMSQAHVSRIKLNATRKYG